MLVVKIYFSINRFLQYYFNNKATSRFNDLTSIINHRRVGTIAKCVYEELGEQPS